MDAKERIKELLDYLREVVDYNELQSIDEIGVLVDELKTAEVPCEKQS